MKKPAQWYETYFSFMEQGKQRNPTFDETLDYLWSTVGRCEPSFSSKLVATLNPLQPIWDTNVLRNMDIARPRHYSKDRMARAKNAYRRLCDRYTDFLHSAEGKLVLSIFNSTVNEHRHLTDVKKVDFVLWQLRADTNSREMEHAP